MAEVKKHLEASVLTGVALAHRDIDSIGPGCGHDVGRKLYGSSWKEWSGEGTTCL